MKEKELTRNRKNNIKLYPIYKMFGMDWIFYYGIQVLFLTQVKNISPADIVLSSSFYAFCYIFFQIFTSMIVEKVGKRNGIVLGQFVNLISIGITIYCPNLVWLMASQVARAVAFGLKTISESSFLVTSLPKTKKRGELFSKIDSKGYSKFCALGALSVLISGFLYAVNPYIPMGLCMTSALIAFIVACNFVDIEKIESETLSETKNKIGITDIIIDLKDGMKFIFHSKRLKTLLIFLGILWGIINVYATYQETLLKDLEIPSYYIGFILAGFQLLVGVFSTKSNSFNDKYKNHVLTYIGLMLTIGSIILGVITIFNIPFPIQLMIITGVFILRAFSKGLYQILKMRYMNNFSNKDILPKIYSVNGIMTNLGNMIIGVIASAILKVTTLPYALLSLGVICTIIVILMAIYSNSRLGLSPEKYSKQDIFEDDL